MEGLLGEEWTFPEIIGDGRKRASENQWIQNNYPFMYVKASCDEKYPCIGVYVVFSRRIQNIRFNLDGQYVQCSVGT